MSISKKGPGAGRVSEPPGFLLKLTALRPAEALLTDSYMAVRT